MRIILVLLSLLAFLPANAQRKLGSEPGKFDFYVLALSWSPSFCEGKAKRGMQCAGDKPYSFVVHGLWPQFNRGFPEYCQIPAPELDRRTVNSMLDIMPAPNLVKHQWEKHGTCSGLSVYQYFENTRKARAAVKIPTQFDTLAEHITVSPQEVEEAFIAANKGMAANMIAVQCNRNNMREVQVCLTRDFAFTPCAEVDNRSCRRDKMRVPPAR